MIGCKIVTETKSSSYMLTPYIYAHKKAILEAWVGGSLVLTLKLKCSESIASLGVGRGRTFIGVIGIMGWSWFTCLKLKYSESS